MIDTHHRRLARPTLLLLVAFACAACNDKEAEGPAPPQTAEPAPVAKVTAPEDRGQQKPGEVAEPASDESAFSHVDSAEAERAASERGHQSAGEPSPAAQPGSGG
jgi:hypothetical protein